jgi:hypothetical protein
MKTSWPVVPLVLLMATPPLEVDAARLVEDFALRRMVTSIDVRKQLTVLRRPLGRITSIDALIEFLPATLSLGLERPAEDVIHDLSAIEVRYVPKCLNTCELARFCRNECAGTTRALGRTVREDLGGVEAIATVPGLAAARWLPSPVDGLHCGADRGYRPFAAASIAAARRGCSSTSATSVVRPQWTGSIAAIVGSRLRRQPQVVPSTGDGLHRGGLDVVSTDGSGAADLSDGPGRNVQRP